MTYQLANADISVPAVDESTGGTLTYRVTASGGVAAHHDVVQLWGRDGTVHVNEYVPIGDDPGATVYTGAVAVPALPVGHYEIRVSVDGDVAVGHASLTVGTPDETHGDGDETQEPTLRPGRRNPEAWVRYLQHELMEWALIFDAEEAQDVAVTGVYDEATERAVRWFQRLRGLTVDGKVGNQTWASLRHEKPQRVGNDGRAPGTYEERGIEARWESDAACFFVPDDDAIHALAYNVGADPFGADDLAGLEVTIRTPGGEVISPPFEFDSHGHGHEIPPGAEFRLRFRDIKSRYGAGNYEVRLRMNTMLGGDLLERTVEVE